MTIYAGLSRIVNYLSIACLCCGKAFANGYKETCIGDNLVLTVVTPTIQTIAVLESSSGGKNRLIRGDLQYLAVEEAFVAGYLSTSFFVADSLVGLEGPDDKEGYFVIDRVSRNVTSGIDSRIGALLFLRGRYGAQDIHFVEPNEIKEWAGCNAG